MALRNLQAVLNSRIAESIDQQNVHRIDNPIDLSGIEDPSTGAVTAIEMQNEKTAKQIAGLGEQEVYAFVDELEIDEVIGDLESNHWTYDASDNFQEFEEYTSADIEQREDLIELQRSNNQQQEIIRKLQENLQHLQKSSNELQQTNNDLQEQANENQERIQQLQEENNAYVRKNQWTTNFLPLIIASSAAVGAWRSGTAELAIIAFFILAAITYFSDRILTRVAGIPSTS